MFDAIVVGARCAGAATAMLLARKGHRVLLLDRATFPSEVPRGHYVHRDGPARLAAWGVLDDVPVGVGPRRSRLDTVLVAAAVREGAELREGFAVDELVWDGDRVAGVR